MRLTVQLTHVAEAFRAARRRVHLEGKTSRNAQVKVIDQYGGGRMRSGDDEQMLPRFLLLLPVKPHAVKSWGDGVGVRCRELRLGRVPSVRRIGKPTAVGARRDKES